MQEESPAMIPQFLPIEQGYRIFIARSPQDDPKLKYRKEIEAIIQDDQGEIDFVRGEIDEFERDCLELHRLELNLSVEEAKAIETEVMEPHRQRWKKLQEYEKLFSKAVKRRFPLKESDLRTLKRIQNRLSLRDEDIARIEARIAPNLPKPKIDPIPTEPKSQPKPEPEIELKSEVGVDYSKLKELLSQEKWKEADEETARVMLKAANQEERGYLDSEDIEKFPCADLRTIDQLWVKYSNGRFGFSVQKKIYLACGAEPDGKYPGDEIWYNFCEQVGWRKQGKWMDYNEFTFGTSAPEGHLPVVRCLCYGWVELERGELFSRAETCNL